MSFLTQTFSFLASNALRLPAAPFTFQLYCQLHPIFQDQVYTFSLHNHTFPSPVTPFRCTYTYTQDSQTKHYTAHASSQTIIAFFNDLRSCFFKLKYIKVIKLMTFISILTINTKQELL